MTKHLKELQNLKLNYTFFFNTEKVVLNLFYKCSQADFKKHMYI